MTIKRLVSALSEQAGKIVPQKTAFSPAPYRERYRPHFSRSGKMGRCGIQDQFLVLVWAALPIFAAYMGQKKLKRFAEIQAYPNVLEYPENMPGQWASFFKNENPITLELACGKGEYTVGLATMYPQRNFIGVDVKGNRIWTGATYSLKNNLTNAAFLRTQILRINRYFQKDEVEEIWITFPDPQLRTSRASKRLTHPEFLRLYNQFLRPHGLIHLKTDSPDLYRFTKTVIRMYGLTLHEDIQNVHAQPEIKEELKIITHYESLDIAQSQSIFYLCFSLPSVLPQKDKELAETIATDEKKDT